MSLSRPLISEKFGQGQPARVLDFLGTKVENVPAIVSEQAREHSANDFTSIIRRVVERLLQVFRFSCKGRMLQRSELSLYP